MIRILILLLSIGIFSGCKLLHHPKPKKIIVNDIPEKWASGKKTEGDLNGWVLDFDDKQLPLIVKEAVGNNFDLRVSAARLEEAFALARIAGADRLPTLNLDGSAGRGRTGQGDVRQHSNDYSLFLRFDWELDIWGKLKDRKKAAEADVRAEYFTFHAARLSLANAVSRFWFNAVEAKLQLLLAEETEKSFLNTYEIIDERFKKGISEALDVRLATIDLANSRQNTQQRKANFDAAVRTLEVLLGRYPAGELKISQHLPPIKKNIPLGLPAEMLNRRPDILAALQNLEAANLRVSENKKELLPGISLSASAGNSAESVEDIFNAEKLIWSLAGNLTQPLFQGGRIRASIQQAKAIEKAEIATLMQSVYTACQEVETAVNAEKFLTEKEKQIDIAVDESQKAAELAMDRYGKGLVDIITLLATQRSEFSSRSELLSVKLQRLLNRLNLYLALGGDFNKQVSKTEE